MDRLTIKRPDGWHVEDWENGADHHGPAIDRLAAYEDTELEPEEIEEQLGNFSAFLCEMTGNQMSKTNYTVDAMISVANDYQQLLCDKCSDREELQKYREADKDGRCVILPCSPGKKVWSGKWSDDLSECVYVCASSMLSDIERGNVVRYTRKEAESVLEAQK